MKRETAMYRLKDGQKKTNTYDIHAETVKEGEEDVGNGKGFAKFTIPRDIFVGTDSEEDAKKREVTIEVIFVPPQYTIKSNAGGKTEVIEEGGTKTIKLTPEEGYKLPAKVTWMYINNDGQEKTGEAEVDQTKGTAALFIPRNLSDGNRTIKYDVVFEEDLLEIDKPATDSNVTQVVVGDQKWVKKDDPSTEADMVKAKVGDVVKITVNAVKTVGTGNEAKQYRFKRLLYTYEGNTEEAEKIVVEESSDSEHIVLAIYMPDAKLTGIRAEYETEPIREDKTGDKKPAMFARTVNVKQDNGTTTRVGYNFNVEWGRGGQVVGTNEARLQGKVTPDDLHDMPDSITMTYTDKNNNKQTRNIIIREDGGFALFVPRDASTTTTTIEVKVLFEPEGLIGPAAPPTQNQATNSKGKTVGVGAAFAFVYGDAATEVLIGQNRTISAGTLEIRADADRNVKTSSVAGTDPLARQEGDGTASQTSGGAGNAAQNAAQSTKSDAKDISIDASVAINLLDSELSAKVGTGTTIVTTDGDELEVDPEQAAADRAKAQQDYETATKEYRHNKTQSWKKYRANQKAAGATWTTITSSDSDQDKAEKAAIESAAQTAYIDAYLGENAPSQEENWVKYRTAQHWTSENADVEAVAKEAFDAAYELEISDKTDSGAEAAWNTYKAKNLNN